MAGSRPYDVTAIGSAIVDVLAMVDDEFLARHGIAKSVMTLIDEERARTLHAALPHPREIAGGSAANTMAGLASLGSRGAFIGKVKRDRLGTAFSEGMSELGISYTTARAEAGPATACCLIAVTPDGERSMSTYLGANLEFSTADVGHEAISRAEILYIEGYLWDAPKAKAACLHAIDVAVASGTRVGFTISDPFVSDRYRDEFLSLLEKKRFDILFANEDEAKSLFKTGSFAAIVDRVKSWGGIAALTRSEKGCVIVQGSEAHAIEAFPVERVIDTTGAGDQFAAGFLYAYVRGKPLPACGKLGTIAASEVISHLGARPETPLRGLAERAGLV